MARRARPLLGTLVTIEVAAAIAGHLSPADRERRETAAIDAAFDAIDAVHRLMAFHHADSDLGRLNQAPVGVAVELHPWTVDVIATALALARESGNAFDCTIARRLVRDGHLPALRDDWLQPAGDAAGGAASEALAIDGLHVWRRRDVLVDLGGIAKGYAVDRAIDVLAGFGLDHALVNAGGDLRHAGSEPAIIHLRQPTAPGRLAATLSLRNAALASSVSGGLHPGAPEPSAIIDTRHDRPLAKGRGVTLIAPSCLLADALTKVVLVSGNRDHPLLAKYGAEVVFAELPGLDDSHA